MLDNVILDSNGVFFPCREQYLGLIEKFWQSGYKFCSDLCAVDYLNIPSRIVPDGILAKRFEVVVSLTSFELRKRVRIRVQLDDDAPRLPSVYEFYRGSEAMEREAYDLLGIVFDNHPDLSRILLPEEWEGHPLRKDYSVGSIPVQFKASTALR